MKVCTILASANGCSWLLYLAADSTFYNCPRNSIHLPVMVAIRIGIEVISMFYSHRHTHNGQ